MSGHKQSHTEEEQTKESGRFDMNRRDFIQTAAAGVTVLGADMASASAPDSGIVFPNDAGVVDVTESPYNAAGDGSTDDTAAIQQAIDDHPNGNRIIYLPNGTYKVSDRLSWSGSSGDDKKRTIMQGESTANTVIKLADNTSGYQDSSNRKGVIWTGQSPAQRFRNSIRTLTVNVGSSNPGAAGIQFMANNQGTIRDVDIVTDDGQGAVGLDMAYTGEIGPLLVRGLFVDGFDIGIKTGGQVNSMTLEDVTLRNQNDEGLNNYSQRVFVRNLASTNDVPAIRNRASNDGAITLLDSSLDTLSSSSSNAAIVNGDALYVRNTTTSGYNKAIDNNVSGGASDVTGDISEYVASGNTDELFSSPDSSLNLTVKESPQLGWDDLSNWANPENYGGDPTDSTDDTQAIQDAIDSGASTVYLPNGGDGHEWTIDGTVNIRNSVKRFIGCEARLAGSGTIQLDDGTPSTVVLERVDGIYSEVNLVHNSSRTWVISSVSNSSLSGDITHFSSTSSGTGDVFIDDVVMGIIPAGDDTPSNSTFIFDGHDVWTRQLNCETKTENGSAEAKVINKGSNLWMLGYKIESAGTAVATKNGSKTEVLGGLLYANDETNDDPAFVDDESAISLAGVKDRNFSGDTYVNLVEETRDGTTRTRTMSDYGDANLFSGYASGEGGSGGSDDTTAPSAPTNLSSPAKTDTSVDLDWDASSDSGGSGLDHYNVYVDGSRDQEVASGTTTATVSDLSSSTSYDFYVTAVDGAGNESSDSNIITVTTDSGGGLPSPWSNQDVGTVSASGSASESSGTFTINGAGSDIWGSSDEFHYVYQSLSGDGSMVAQVQSVENTNSWAKAGVMIRETLDADSRHAMMIVTPGQGTSFQYRSSTGGTSNDSTPGDGITAPHWVKIERSGDTLTGYKSSDGSSWTQVGSTTITMATDVKIGMPVTSHNDGTLCTADFSDTSVSSGGSGGTTEDADIVQASSAPAIDASVDSVWSNANQYALNNSVGTISSSGDCSADWKALWDSNNLYLLAEVTDDSLTTDSSSAFKDDMVEVYIDGDNSGGSSYDGTNDFQYGFRYDDASVYTGSNSVNDTTGVNHASTSTSGGWRLEVEIPWSTIGVSVSSGTVIGFDVHVVDDDDGGDRDGKLMWHDTDDDAYTNPSTFGDAELSSNTVDGDTTAPTAPSNLSSPAKTDTSVDLDWDASSDTGGSGLDHYNVYVDGSRDQEVASGTTTATVSGLSSSTSYDFYVTAVDGAGNESSDSNIITVTTETGSDTYQAEDASIGGGAEIRSSTSGYNGTGYVNPDTSGSYIEWTNVNVSSAGSYDLEFRYTLGTSSPRDTDLIVNGSVVATPTFTETTSTWETITETVSLNSSDNTVRIETTGDDGGNVDEMTVK